MSWFPTLSPCRLLVVLSAVVLGLLAAGLGVEREPDEIPAVGGSARVHHASLPTGSPHSVSAWRFSGVMPAINCSRV